MVKHSSNELGRLAQEVGDRVNVTDNIFSLEHEKIQTDRIKYITYGQIVCNYLPK